MVTPAYRLRSASGADLSVPVSSRPKLVLLRAVHDAQAADIDGVDGSHYARVGVIDRPDPPLSPAQTPAELAAYRRQQARQRCTFVLRLLAATAVTTGIMGALPALRLAWIFTGITGIAALALAGLIAYAREIEGQRRQFRSRPWDHEAPTVEDHRADVHGADAYGRDVYGVDAPWAAAQSGLPGAWDEEMDQGADLEFPPQRRAATGG
jgi:hypothetical protein